MQKRLLLKILYINLQSFLFKGLIEIFFLNLNESNSCFIYSIFRLGLLRRDLLMQINK